MLVGKGSWELNLLDLHDKVSVEVYWFFIILKFYGSLSANNPSTKFISSKLK